MLGDTDRLDISLFDATGQLLTVVRGGGAPVPTTESDGRRWRREIVASFGPDMPDDFVERYQRAPYRDSYPAFEKVGVDTMGRLWLGTTVLMGDDERRWIVFDQAGGPVGSLKLPAAAEVLDITDDRLVTLHRDDLGVEEITSYTVDGLEAGGR